MGSLPDRRDFLPSVDLCVRWESAAGLRGTGRVLGWKPSPRKGTLAALVTKTGRNLVETRLRPVGYSATSLAGFTQLRQSAVERNSNRFL
jgi:hypothetical protein